MCLGHSVRVPGPSQRSADGPWSESRRPLGPDASMETSPKSEPGAVGVTVRARRRSLRSDVRVDSTVDTRAHCVFVVETRPDSTVLVWAVTGGSDG